MALDAKVTVFGFDLSKVEGRVIVAAAAVLALAIVIGVAIWAAMPHVAKHYEPDVRAMKARIVELEKKLSATEAELRTLEQKKNSLERELNEKQSSQDSKQKSWDHACYEKDGALNFSLAGCVEAHHRRDYTTCREEATRCMEQGMYRACSHGLNRMSRSEIKDSVRWVYFYCA